MLPFLFFIYKLIKPVEPSIILSKTVSHDFFASFSCSDELISCCFRFTIFAYFLKTSKMKEEVKVN